ncbi:MAG: hypothetical protein OXI01_05660 [Albidovulum sp.]|nr:hypothetical protein [Albidovulum sp.]
MNADGCASFQRAGPLELARLAGTPTPNNAEAQVLLVAASRGGCADQVNVVLLDAQPRRIARPFFRQQGENQNPEGRVRVEGEALPQVVGFVETRVHNSRSDHQCAEEPLDLRAQLLPSQRRRMRDSMSSN